MDTSSKIAPYISPQTIIEAKDGRFEVSRGDSTIKGTKFLFSNLMLELGLLSLENSRSSFSIQFQRAEEKVKCMEELNDIVQKINSFKTSFKDDAKGDDKASCSGLYSAIEAFNKKYPNNKVTLNSSDFSDSNGKITKKGLEALASNAQTVQSTLSSENEQQSMRTNQAMNRSSGFLQQLQSMMQTAKEAVMAAAKAGGM